MCAGSISGDAASFQLVEGGSNPTSALYLGRLRKSDWWVEDVSLKHAHKLVADHHYARGGSNTATHLNGLYPRGESSEQSCVAVAWWLPPTKSAALATYPKNWQGVLALSRLVVVPGVPKNACSFLIRHSMRRIDRNRWPCLVSYADTWQGHDGGIYRAAGFIEVGRTKPEAVYVLNGRMVARKAGPKTRTKAEMLAMGCELIGRFSKVKFVHIEPKQEPTP